MATCRRSRTIGKFATVACSLVGAVATLIGCRDDLKEIVVVESRSMHGQAAPSCRSTVARPVVEWDSELEFGCTGGVPCPLLAADSRPCADRSDGTPAVDLAHSIAAAAGREPGCDGIVVVEGATLRSGPLRRSIQRPHWMLEIAHRSSEEGGSWVLVRREARMIGGYGQGTAPAIVREMCALVRESAASRNRAGGEP
jgi:hypothetical protein